MDLKPYQDKLGFTREQLAEHLEVSRSTLYEWDEMGAPYWVEYALNGLRAALVLPHLAIPMLGPDLMRARTALKLSQADFSHRLGISRRTVSRWENDTPPSWLSYAVIALAILD